VDAQLISLYQRSSNASNKINKKLTKIAEVVVSSRVPQMKCRCCALCSHVVIGAKQFFEFQAARLVDTGVWWKVLLG